MANSWSELARKETENNIKVEMSKITQNYMTIYDEYYNEDIVCNRDCAFLKDLADSIIGISAVLEVYARDGEIDSHYVIKNLNHSTDIINSVKEYYKIKEKENL